MERVGATGKTPDLFELEMWLQSFERFFRVKNQPLSDKEQRSLTLRNWSEELRLVDNVLLRVVQLCASILTEEQVGTSRSTPTSRSCSARPPPRRASASSASPSRTCTCC